jgi:hypothetical protein
LKTIEPDTLISLILEEFKCQKTEHTHRAGGAKSKDDTDEALFVVNVEKTSKESPNVNLCAGTVTSPVTSNQTALSRSRS